jgi:hypothetical protein
LRRPVDRNILEGRFPSRRGRYRRERLIAGHGADMKLTDLLATLADCAKARWFSIYDRCQACYVRYYR